MRSPRPRWVPLAVLIVAAGLLIASVAWVSGQIGPGGMPGRGMTTSGDGPLADVSAVRRAADRFGEQWDLRSGEVMEFDNGFYVELADPSGDLATEVLVDPSSGAVQLEFGPAMMWNTAYGLHRGRVAAATLAPEEALSVADEWLGTHRPGERAAEPEAFPGYYTLHTLMGDRVSGMLSVHGTSGAVWFHSWHGRFVGTTEPE